MIDNKKTKVEIFGERLKKVVDLLELMKTYGLSEEILIAWLRVKLKISEKDARKIIRSMSEFYTELVAKSTLEQI